MAFLFYERHTQDGKPMLRPTGENFRLAGYNLIFRAWEKRGKPTNQGWHVTANELISLHTNETNNYETRRLIIDFHPTATWRIGVVELLDIYAYTYQGATQEEASWTPMMFRLRNVFYEEYEDKITSDEKKAITDNLAEPQTSDDFVEFLGLGSTWGWNKGGPTNAVFIQSPAREFFRDFF
jgi:hypothetical protein